MIKEFAFGLAQRHYFQDSSKICDWMNIDKDTYMSLYEFDDSIKDFFAQKHTLSGFDGLVYIPDEFILDVDGKDKNDLENARQKTIGLLLLLDDLCIPYHLYFSGNKGFHVGIPSTAFRWKPDALLHLKVKDALTNAGIFDYADPSVIDKIRLIRIVNTMNLKAQLWKREITRKDLDVVDITAHMQELGKQPGPVSDFELECNPVFDVMARVKPDQQVEPEFISQGRMPDPVNYPCISSMLSSKECGSRHATALRLSAWFRWLYPESTVQVIMEQWRQQVDDPASPFTIKEMTSIVNSAYDAHGGSGNRYGCNDKIMDDHCSNTCKIYKSKQNQTVMDSHSMETSLINFIRSKVKPLNFGDIWTGEDFPIYPGEVVIIQAPPKSMKTMFLQNLMVGFKRPTYFIEMEMSPRQIWSRFVQIEMGWSEEQLREHYQKMRNGMDERFKWLTVDYSSPYANEMEKRISMLSVKPEIVVVDHMGLFKSKHRDPNMKTEEASQALMELAVRNNIVVFSISEITKSAFHEGHMNIASAKGSFRTAYNTNKLLSVIPSRSKITGLIEELRIRCEANREREHIDMKLEVIHNKLVKNELVEIGGY